MLKIRAMIRICMINIARKTTKLKIMATEGRELQAFFLLY